MKTYQCHKRVKAAQIIEVIEVQHENATPSVALTLESGMLVPKPDGTNYVPQPGDYLVEYEDGYRSISPKKAFEDGYAAEGDINFAKRFDFGLALCALKRGKRVARAGWNGKGMWLSLSGDGVREIPASAFWSQNNADFAQAQPGGVAKVLPCITMKTVTGEILMGWLASQTDMLADDWMIVD